MPDIENFDETNRIRFKQFILKGEFFFVGGWHAYDIPASITVKNNAFVEYIAMIKGKLTHTPTDVVKDIQGDFSIGKKYIDDQNQIDINGETNLEESTYRLFPDLKGQMIFDKKVDYTDLDSSVKLQANFIEDDNNTEIEHDKTWFSGAITVPSIRALDILRNCNLEYAKAELEESISNSIPAQITVKDFWSSTDINSNVNLNADAFNRTLFVVDDLIYLATISNYDLKCDLDITDKNVRQLYLYGRVGIQSNQYIYSMYSKMLVPCTSNTEFAASITVDDYIKELLGDLQIDPEYENYDLLDSVVHMHDYVTPEIDGTVFLSHYHTFRQFNGLIDIVIPYEEELEGFITVPVIVNGCYKDIPGSVITGNRQLEDIYSEIHILNDKYIKPEPTDDFLVIDSMNDLLDIPREMLKPGMKVYVKETKREYRLGGSIRKRRKECECNHE